MYGFFRKLSNKLYKNSTTYKSLRWIISLAPFNFTIRFFKAFFFLDKLDSNNPYEGVISQNFGFCKSSVSKDCVETLRDMYYENNNSKNYIFINKTNIRAFDEIFGIIEKPIMDYLGPGVKLDGIEFFVCKKNNIKSDLYDVISTNWHTDNVGARLKVFVCFEGDGTKPTLLIKPKNITKSISYKLKIYFLEVIRWFGIENDIAFNSEVELRHKEGSLIIFDTQFLHRGERKKSPSQRSLLHMEFSNPEKHEFFDKGISKGSKLPIGTNIHNQFYFSDEVLAFKNIYKFFDQKRITKLKEYFKYEKI